MLDVSFNQRRKFRSVHNSFSTQRKQKSAEMENFDSVNYTCLLWEGELMNTKRRERARQDSHRSESIRKWA